MTRAEGGTLLFSWGRKGLGAETQRAHARADAVVGGGVVGEWWGGGVAGCAQVASGGTVVDLVVASQVQLA